MIRFVFILLLLNKILIAQTPDWKEDFVFEKGTSDTIYLAPDEFSEGSYLVFHRKSELYKYLGEINSNKVGETIFEYQYSIEESPDRYKVKDELAIDAYYNFMNSQNQIVPKNFNLNHFTHLTESERQNFLDFLFESWQVPVHIYESKDGTELMITELNWRKKEFLDMMNELMKKGFLNKAPLNFTFDGIEVIENETILWNDLQRIELDRETNELIVKTNSGKEIKFSYPENQYSCLADFHVNFLAFYKRMLN